MILTVNWYVYINRDNNVNPDTDVPPIVTSIPFTTMEWNKNETYLTWVVWDDYAPKATWVAYRNGIEFATGSWFSGAEIKVNISDFMLSGEASIGTHNFTLIASEGHGRSAQNSTWVTIYNESPEDLSNLTDSAIEWFTPNYGLTWCFVDNSILAGTWEFYSNGSLDQTGSWTSNVTFCPTLDSSALSIGQHNFSLHVRDGLGGYCEDSTLLNVTNTAPIIAGPSGQSIVPVGGSCTFQWALSDPSVANGHYTIYRDSVIQQEGEFTDDDPINPGWQKNVTFIPDTTQFGEYYYNIVVTDGGGQIQNRFLVLNVTNLPAFISIPSTTMEWNLDDPYLTWVVWDDFAPDPTWVAYRDGIEFATGTWITGEEINVDISDFLINGGLSLGTHNFTLITNDGHAGSIQNSTWVTIYNESPEELSNLTDSAIEWLTPNYGLTWCFVDNSILAGTWEFYSNGSLDQTGSWTSNVTFSPTLDSSALSIGHHNFSLHVRDGLGGYCEDSTWLNVTNTAPIIAGPSGQSAIAVGGSCNFTWALCDPSVANGHYTIYGNSTIQLDGIFADDDLNTPGWQKTITFSPDTTQLGEYYYNITVSDGAVQITHPILVLYVKNPPTFADFPALPPELALDFEYDPLSRGEGAKILSWRVVDLYYRAGYAGYNFTRNGDPYGTEGTWVHNDIITLDVSNLPAGWNNISICVWDGWGLNQSMLHRLVVDNDPPDITLIESCYNPNWWMNTYIRGYNYGGTVPQNITWTVTDDSVGAGATYWIIKGSLTFDVIYWDTVPYIMGTWTNGTNIISIDPSRLGLPGGRCAFKLWVNDCVPGYPIDTEGAQIDRVTILVNLPPTFTQQPPDEESYLEGGSLELTWHVSDEYIGNTMNYLVKKYSPGTGWVTIQSGTFPFGIGTISVTAQGDTGTVEYSCEVWDNYGYDGFGGYAVHNVTVTVIPS